MGNVNQSSCQISGVGCTQRRIGKTLSGSIGGNKVFQYGKSLTEVCLDRHFDGFTGRVGHQTTHTADLADLVFTASRSGVSHDKQIVQGSQRIHQRVGHIVCRFIPDLDNFLITFLVGYKTLAERFFVFINHLLGFRDDAFLCFRNFHIRDTDGNSGSRGVMESHIFNIIQHDGCSGIAVHPIAPVDNLTQLFLVTEEVNFQCVRIRVSVYKSQVLRNLLVENKSSHRGLYQPTSCIFFILIHPYFYFRVKTHFMVLVSHQHFVDICENFAVSLFRRRVSLFHTRMGQIVASQNHILCRRRNRRSVFRRQDVVNRKHQESGFCLSFYGKGYMHRHLVAVEVRVKGRTYQRVKLDRLTFYQYRLKSLDSQSMKGRGTVEHNRMLLDNAFQNVPYLRTYFFHHSLGALDVMGVTVFHQFFHNKRLEQFQSHFLWQSTLPEPQFRTYYDYGTAGVVNTLAQQVLSETPLLPFQHIGKGF